MCDVAEDGGKREKSGKSGKSGKQPDIVGPEDFPDTRMFWRWAGQATRPIVGWVLIGLGAIAITIGYFGVSREALVAKQLPYLISGGISGMVLVAVGAFFLGTEDLRKQLLRLDRIEEQVDELHAVLLSRRDAPSRAGNGTGREGGRGSRGGRELVALAGGSTYHRSGCQMVTGKDGAEAVTSRTIARRGLTPCGVCEPELVKA